MTEIDLAYFNYANGGLDKVQFHGSSGTYRFEGLVRTAGQHDRWPDIFVMGEAEEYGFKGGLGLYGAATALSEASGRPYLPLLGSLPREWGPVGPAVFVDAQKVRVHQWFSGSEPDFRSRSRNCLLWHPPGRPDDLNAVVTGHGDIAVPSYRLFDAQAWRHYANPAMPCAIMLDWNHTPSGPMCADDFEKYAEPWQYTARTKWEHGPAQGGPQKPYTEALDYLVGWWDEAEQRRVGGIGFHHVGELAGVTTPTNFEKPNGRTPTQIDGAVVNEPWAKALVLDSVEVHEPVDPENPDSDHKRFSFAIDV